MKLHEKVRVTIFVEPEKLNTLDDEIARLKKIGELTRATTRNQIINSAIEMQLEVMRKI